MNFSSLDKGFHSSTAVGFEEIPGSLLRVIRQRDVLTFFSSFLGAKDDVSLFTKNVHERDQMTGARDVHYGRGMT